MSRPALDRSAGAIRPPWWTGGPCRCGRMMLTLSNEGTCVLCGTGRAHDLPRADLVLRAARLPRDLGPVIRDPRLPMYYHNVVPREHVDIMFGRAA